MTNLKIKGCGAHDNGAIYKNGDSRIGFEWTIWNDML